MKYDFHGVVQSPAHPCSDGKLNDFPHNHLMEIWATILLDERDADFQWWYPLADC